MMKNIVSRENNSIEWYMERVEYLSQYMLPEPGCAVLEAVGQGLISDSRYVSYVQMLEDDEKHR